MTYPTPEPTGAFLRFAIEAVTNIDLYIQAEQDLDLHPSCVGGIDQIRRRAGELARALAADWLRTEAYYVASEPLVEIHDVFANLDDAVSDAERATRECGGVFLVLRAGEVVERVGVVASAERVIAVAEAHP